MKVKNFCSKLFLVLTLMLAIVVLYPQVSVEAKAKMPVITVKKIDQKTAKKVHKQLMKGKAFKLRFPGIVKSPYPAVRQKNFYPKCEKLMKKVAKCTDYGFNLYPIFYAGIGSGDALVESKGHIVYTVKKKYCREYIFGIKFAKQELGDLRARISEIISETEKTYEALTNGTAGPAEGHDNLDELISKAKTTISSLKELDKYLAKTKFRNLSESMKARILLEVGCIYNRSWGKTSMEYSESKHGHLDTFKALYQRRAYGSRSSDFARLTCKICGVFGIGDFDYLGRGGAHAVARTKLKTFGGKTRYAIVEGGSFGSYNSFVGYKVLDFNVKYRKSYKKMKPIKKINERTQQLKEFSLRGRADEVYDISTGNKIITYYFELPKSEW